jgi:glycosyltransferase involved in cell wall biosynthesis
VHDWLTGMRGGEKVLEALCQLMPSADIFTLVHVPGSVSSIIESHRITTSVLQRIPRVAEHYRYYLPLMPSAIEQFRLTGYDLVVSSSHCVAKGAKVPSGVPHICYCHTPMRYVWDQYNDYFGATRSAWPVRAAAATGAPPLRRWDRATAGRVTHFVANSENVRERIGRFYGREAEVIHPPVDTTFYDRGPDAREDFYLIVSAFAPYKRIDLALEAFRELDRDLVIVGTGQEADRLRRAAGPRTRFLGWTTPTELRDLYRRCRALVFPGEEDFGIVPVEAMACGAPVIAYEKGGAIETVIHEETGILFHDQTAEQLIEAVHRLEARRFDGARIRQQALRFSREVFDATIAACLARASGPRNVSHPPGAREPR